MVYGVAMRSTGDLFLSFVLIHSETRKKTYVHKLIMQKGCFSLDVSSCQCPNFVWNARIIEYVVRSIIAVQVI